MPAVRGVGPVEPGEGTCVLEAAPEEGPAAPRGRGRRVLGAATVVLGLLAGGGYLWATRPEPPPPPFPSQVTEVRYLGWEPTPRDAPEPSFSFALELSIRTGTPVTVTRISQPYAGLAVRANPAPPFTAEAGTTRKIVVTLHVTQCRKVPWNAGLPFLDVTLRNMRAIEVRGFTLGPRYAQRLSQGVQVACGNPFA